MAIIPKIIRATKKAFRGVFENCATQNGWISTILDHHQAMSTSKEQKSGRAILH